MKTPPLNTPIKVRWLDSTSVCSWKYRSDGKGYNEAPKPISTIGFFIGETPVSISISSSLGEKEDDGFVGYLDPLIIPRGCIIEMRRL